MIWDNGVRRAYSCLHESVAELFIVLLFKTGLYSNGSQLTGIHIPPYPDRAVTSLASYNVVYCVVVWA